MTPLPLLRVLVSAALALASLAALAADRYVVRVVPQFPPEKIFKTWRPVLDRISADTGVELELKVDATIPEFEHRFLEGEPDFAYMNPYHAVMARRAQGYEPIVRDGKNTLSGILVVRADSPLQTIRELEGATLAFPAPNAFGASLYMRALLDAAGLHIQPNYVETHSNVYRHVLAGKALAGGAVRRTLDSEPEGIRQRLRVLYETPPVSPHPLVAHPRVPRAVREAVRQAFLALSRDPEAAAQLAAIQIPAPVAAAPADYQPLESLGVERFVVLER